MKLCSKCKTNPKAPNHNYCRQCRNEAVRKCINAKGGDWAYVLADEERHKKALARKLVANWLKRGKMVKGPCEVCGVIKVTAHHEDYGKPSEVRWLCVVHHEEADKQKELVDSLNKGV
jgi:hypothetical protein